MPRKKIATEVETTTAPEKAAESTKTTLPAKRGRSQAKPEADIPVERVSNPPKKLGRKAPEPITAPTEVVEFAPPVTKQPAPSKKIGRKQKPAESSEQASLLPEDSESTETNGAIDGLAVAFRPRGDAKRPAARTDRAAKPAAKAAEPKAIETPVPAQTMEEDGIIFEFRSGSKPVDAKKPEPKKQPPIRKPKPENVVQTPIEKVVDYGGRILDEDGLPVPVWRAVQPRATTSTPSQPRPFNPSAEGDRESSDDGFGQKRSRRRDRRGGPRSEEFNETLVSTAVETEAAEPVVAAKVAIPTPESAPQIHLRNGLPTIVREHRVYPPLFFHGNVSDDRHTVQVFDEMRMAADAGIHLHSLLVDLVVSAEGTDRALEFATKCLSRAVSVDPEAQVMFRVKFVPADGWQKQYPRSAYRNRTGQVAAPSVCDDEYWLAAQDCLTNLVGALFSGDKRHHILGIHLDGAAWFLDEKAGYDTSEAASIQFRKWARQRYQNDEVTLHASWFDGSTRFDSIQIPTEADANDSVDKFIRASRKQRRRVDYHLFLSDATVHRIGELAYGIKQASEGNFLVGVSYGYTFEWSHPSSCHLSLGKLLRTPEVDLISGPPSYRNREPGGAASFPCPIDSFALNGKLYLSEEDFKTSLAQTLEPDDFNPPLRTPQALESVHWRGAGSALAHGSGAIWMDQWGNGWLKTASVWSRAAQVRDALTANMGAPKGDPEVAVFIDERALAYLVDSDAFQLLVQNVRESVMRAGVSAAFYLMSDLAHREHFPDSKLYLFVNAWDVRQDLRAAIKSRLQKDGKVLFWLYAAGLFDSGRESLERAREVTGIALKPQPFYSKAGTTILNRRHVLSEAFPDLSISGSAKLDPSYFAIPENATVLGEYTNTGLPSFVVKEFREGDRSQHWTSVFLGEPVVTPALVRSLAQLAQVRVWNFQDDVVHVREPFCTIHCTGNGMRALALPDKYTAYNLTTREWMPVEGSSLKFYGVDGTTFSFVVGPKADIEHLLSLDQTELLRMETYPERDVNVRIDNFAFDVPIVKLDEWREGNDSEDVSDEWFLRAPQIVDTPEVAEESPDRIGRRRRRRRTGRGGDEGGRPEGATMFADDDLNMNVMFRKRD